MRWWDVKLRTAICFFAGDVSQKAINTRRRQLRDYHQQSGSVLNVPNDVAAKGKLSLKIRCIAEKERILVNLETRGKLSGGIKRGVQELPSLSQYTERNFNTNSAFVSYKSLSSRRETKEECKGGSMQDIFSAGPINIGFNSWLPSVILNPQQNNQLSTLINPTNNFTQEDKSSMKMLFNILPINIIPQVQLNIPVCMPMPQYVMAPYTLEPIPNPYTNLSPL